MVSGALPALRASPPDCGRIDGREGGVPDPATSGPRLGPDRHRGRLPAAAGGRCRSSRSPGTSTRPTFNFGNVERPLACWSAPAERADVIVDFSPYAGQDPDRLQRRSGGLPGARPALRLLHRQPRPDRDGRRRRRRMAGFGPNTRTIMQIKVADVAHGAGLRPGRSAGEAFTTTRPTASSSAARTRSSWHRSPTTRPTTPPSRPPGRSGATPASRTDSMTVQDGRRHPRRPCPGAQGDPRRDGRGLRRVRPHERQARARSCPTSAPCMQNFVLQNYVDPPHRDHRGLRPSTALSPVGG